MLPDFFEKLIGKPGKAVLDNLVKSEEQLRAFVVPRVIVGWLKAVDEGDVGIPAGSPFLELKKSARGFSGSVTIGSCQHSFEDSLDSNVAAMVALAACSGAIEVTAKASDLAKIAKTIDLLCKSAAAKPEVKVEHILEPTVKEDAPVVVLKIKKGKKTIPCVKKTACKPLNLMKSQADARCEVCAGSLFRDMKFVGCECLVDLAKSVNTKVCENFLELTFSEDMDQDAWLCLASLVR